MKLIGVYTNFDVPPSTYTNVVFVIKFILNKKLITNVMECRYDYNSLDIIITESCVSKFKSSVISYYMHEECFLAILEGQKNKQEFLMGIGNKFMK